LIRLPSFSLYFPAPFDAQNKTNRLAQREASLLRRTPEQIKEEVDRLKRLGMKTTSQAMNCLLHVAMPSQFSRLSMLFKHYHDF
jgi:hypothetical protein